MPERVLSARELNRAILARQGLLERTRTPLARMLERMGALQAQYAPSMYLGLWSRVEGFEPDRAVAAGGQGAAARAAAPPDTLGGALERRSVVQATLMRTTIHLVSRADYWPLAVATRAARREALLRVPALAPPAADVERIEAVLRAELAGGPLTRRAVEELVGKAGARAANGLLDLVRVPPSGTWERRSADLWGLAEWWLGAPEIEPPAAVERLVRRYLTGFGPATRAEIANWAGLRPADIAPALERLPLRRMRFAGDGAELLDLPRLPLPAADTPAPARLLPTWDATLLVHARRAVILPEHRRERIFSPRNPHSYPTFLVDGAVAGTWRIERDGRVSVEAFEPLAPADARAVREEADRLEAWL